MTASEQELGAGQTPENEACPECGATINPQEGCSACLLQLGMSDYNPSPTNQFLLPTAQELDAMMPQLEVQRLVGRGGMGAIYGARQTTLDRDVAVKLIARELSTDTAFLDRFEREAKALAKLSHANIVTVYDFGHTADGMAFLIMEFVDGMNLRDAIRDARLGVVDTLELISTTCRGLEYAHTKGVVHRDIKPENILLSDEGAVKIADFGIAKIVDESIKTPTLTATRQVLGSLHYLAPEHMEAPTDVDHRVDLYALGVVLYECLTGQLPLGRFESPSQLVDGVDESIDAICEKALSRKPSERYQSAAEFAADVNRARAALATQSGAQLEFAPGPQKTVSVPFSAETFGGFGEAVGMLHATQAGLNAEFRLRDTIWGTVKSKTHVVDIPTSAITRVEVTPRMFNTKLLLSTDKISRLGELPNAESGVVELKIKRGDTDYAQRLASTLGFAQKTAAGKQGADSNDSNRLVFAILLAVCAVCNMGVLAVVQALSALEIDDTLLKVAVCVTAAVTLAPIVVVQLLASICNLAARPRGLSIAATVVSMLPVTPVWIFSFPLAIWARRWLFNSNRRSAVATKGWGATTTLFGRETRLTRAFAALNVLAVVVALGLFAGYRAGWYASRVNFRVVAVEGEELNDANLYNAIRGRLSSMDINVYGARGERLDVYAWAFNSGEIRERLRLRGDLKFVWLAKAVDEAAEATDSLIELDESSASEVNYVPLAAGLDHPMAVRTADSLGSRIATLGTPLELDPEQIGKAEVNHRAAVFTHQKRSPKRTARQLVIDLTSNGRAALSRSIPANRGGLGLVVDGLVYAYANDSDIENDRITFNLADAQEISSTAIIAALQGPDLPAILLAPQ